MISSKILLIRIRIILQIILLISTLLPVYAQLPGDTRSNPKQIVFTGKAYEDVVNTSLYTITAPNMGAYDIYYRLILPPNAAHLRVRTCHSVTSINTEVIIIDSTITALDKRVVTNDYYYPASFGSVFGNCTNRQNIYSTNLGLRGTSGMYGASNFRNNIFNATNGGVYFIVLKSFGSSTAQGIIRMTVDYDLIEDLPRGDVPVDPRDMQFDQNGKYIFTGTMSGFSNDFRGTSMIDMQNKFLRDVWFRFIVPPNFKGLHLHGHKGQVGSVINYYRPGSMQNIGSQIINSSNSISSKIEHIIQNNTFLGSGGVILNRLNTGDTVLVQFVTDYTANSQAILECTLLDPNYFNVGDLLERPLDIEQNFPFSIEFDVTNFYNQSNLYNYTTCCNQNKDIYLRTILKPNTLYQIDACGSQTGTIDLMVLNSKFQRNFNVLDLSSLDLCNDFSYKRAITYFNHKNLPDTVYIVAESNSTPQPILKLNISERSTGSKYEGTIAVAATLTGNTTLTDTITLHKFEGKHHTSTSTRYIKFTVPTDKDFVRVRMDSPHRVGMSSYTYEIVMLDSAGVEIPSGAPRLNASSTILNPPFRSISNACAVAAGKTYYLKVRFSKTATDTSVLYTTLYFQKIQQMNASSTVIGTFLNPISINTPTYSHVQSFSGYTNALTHLNSKFYANTAPGGPADGYIYDVVYRYTVPSNTANIDVLLQGMAARVRIVLDSAGGGVPYQIIGQWNADRYEFDTTLLTSYQFGCRLYNLAAGKVIYIVVEGVNPSHLYQLRVHPNQFSHPAPTGDRYANAIAIPQNVFPYFSANAFAGYRDDYYESYQDPARYYGADLPAGDTKGKEYLSKDIVYRFRLPSSFTVDSLIFRINGTNHGPNFTIQPYMYIVDSLTGNRIATNQRNFVDVHGNTILGIFSPFRLKANVLQNDRAYYILVESGSLNPNTKCNLEIQAKNSSNAFVTALGTNIGETFHNPIQAIVGLPDAYAINFSDYRSDLNLSSATDAPDVFFRFTAGTQRVYVNANTVFKKPTDFVKIYLLYSNGVLFTEYTNYSNRSIQLPVLTNNTTYLVAVESNVDTTVTISILSDNYQFYPKMLVISTPSCLVNYPATLTSSFIYNPTLDSLIYWSKWNSLTQQFEELPAFTNLKRIVLNLADTGEYKCRIILKGNKVYTDSVKVNFPTTMTGVPLSLVFPQHNAEGVPYIGQPLTLSWTSAPNVLNYHLFIWPFGTSQPSTPQVENIKNNMYTFNKNSALLNHNTKYNWRVQVQNSQKPCFTYVSTVSSFTTEGKFDLEVLSISAPNLAVSGTQIEIGFAIRNRSTVTSVSFNWIDKVYLALDANGENEIITLGFYPNVSSLAANQQYFRKEFVTIPQTYRVLYRVAKFGNSMVSSNQGSDQLFGRYYLVVRAFPADFFSDFHQADINLSNNVMSKPLDVVYPPFPDISVTDVSIAPTICYNGDTIQFTYKLRNVGTAAISGSHVFTDFLGLSTVPSFAGTSANQHPNFITFNENLSVSGTRFIELPNGLKLYNTTPPHSTAPLVLFPDSSVIISGRYVVPYKVTGNYFPFVVSNYLKNVFEGASYVNNFRSGPLLQVLEKQAANLVVGQVSLSGMSLYQTQKLAISYRVTNVSPIEVNKNVEFFWRDQVRLVHTANPNFSYVISTRQRKTSTINENSQAQFNRNFHSGAAYIDTVFYQIPPAIPNGIYTLVVHIDQQNEVFENSNEADNILSITGILISTALGVYPDPDIKNTFDTLYLGQNAKPYTVTVKNRGLVPIAANTPGAFSTTIISSLTGVLYNYKSFKNYFGPGDSIVFLNTLVPQTEILRDTVVIATVTSRLLFDPSLVIDANISNNQHQKIVPLVLRKSRDSDLVLSFTGPASAVSGDRVNLNFVVRNTGQIADVFNGLRSLHLVSVSGNADPIALDFSNNVYTTGLLIKAGEHQNFSFLVKIPDRIRGNFKLVGEINRSYNEKNFDNNIAEIPFVVLAGTYPDIELLAVSIQGSNFRIGDTLPVFYRVTNKGDRVFSGNISWDAFHNEEFTTITNSRSIHLASHAITVPGGILAVGQTITGAIPFILQRATQNKFTNIIISLNKDQIVPEWSMANNTRHFQIFVLPALPSDLLVTQVSSIGPGIAGHLQQNVVIISNAGPNLSRGFVNIPTYFSLDAMLSPNDVLFKSRYNKEYGYNTVNVQMPPHTSALYSFSGIIADLKQEGDYYTIAQVNSRKTLTESDYENNQRVSIGTNPLTVETLPLNTTYTRLLSSQILVENSPTIVTYLKVVGQINKDMMVQVVDAFPKSVGKSQVFVKKGSIPDANNFDFTSDPYETDSIQKILVSDVENATYYITIYTPYRPGMDPSSHIQVSAALYDFGLLSVSPGLVGDYIVTTKVRGFVLTDIASIQLIDPATNQVVSNGFVVQQKNSTQLRVRWNLDNLPHKTYHLRVVKTNNQWTQLDNALKVEHAYIDIVKTPLIDAVIRLSSVTEIKKTIPFGALFRNNSNIDIPDYKAEIILYKPMRVHELGFICKDCYNLITYADLQNNPLGKVDQYSNQTLRGFTAEQFNNLPVKNYYEDGGILNIPFRIRYFEPKQEVVVTSLITFGPYPPSTSEFPFGIAHDYRSRSTFVSELFNSMEYLRNVIKLANQYENLELAMPDASLANHRKAFMDSTIRYLLASRVLQAYDTIGKRGVIYDSTIKIVPSELANAGESMANLRKIKNCALEIEDKDTLYFGNFYYPIDTVCAVRVPNPNAKITIKFGGDLSRVNLYTDGFTLLESPNPIPELPFIDLDFKDTKTPRMPGEFWDIVRVPPAPNRPNDTYKIQLRKTSTPNPKVMDLDDYAPDPSRARRYPPNGSGLYYMPYNPSNPTSPYGPVTPQQDPSDIKCVPGTTPRGFDGNGLPIDPCALLKSRDWPGMANDFRKARKDYGTKPGKSWTSFFKGVNKALPPTGNCGIDATRSFALDAIGTALDFVHPDFSNPSKVFKKFLIIKDAVINSASYGLKLGKCISSSACDLFDPEKSSGYCQNVEDAGKISQTTADAITCFKGTDKVDWYFNMASCIPKLAPKDCGLGGDSSKPGNPNNFQPPQPLSTRPFTRPCDPNEIIGPLGHSLVRYIGPDEVLKYKIMFENDSIKATVAARKVLIVVPYAANVDPFSLEGIRFGFGSHVFDVPAGKNRHTQTVTSKDSKFKVQFTYGYNLNTKELFWLFDTYDINGFEPADPRLGFLPPNNAQKEGEGFVEFMIKAKRPIIDRDTVSFQAAIYFDQEAPIITNRWTNTYLFSNPFSSVSGLRLVDTDVMEVTTQFSMSAIKSYELFYAAGGGPYRKVNLLLSAEDNPARAYIDASASKHCFVSVATDFLGAVQPFDTTFKKCFTTSMLPVATLLGLPNTTLSSQGVVVVATVSSNVQWRLLATTPGVILSKTSGSLTQAVQIQVPINRHTPVPRAIPLVLSFSGGTRVYQVLQMGYTRVFFTPDSLHIPATDTVFTVTASGTNIAYVTPTAPVQVQRVVTTAGYWALELQVPANNTVNPRVLQIIAHDHGPTADTLYMYQKAYNLDDTTTTVQNRLPEGNVLQVFPIPAKDILYVKASAYAGKFQLVHVSGFVVQTFEITKGVNKVSVKGLAPGIYYLQGSSASKTYKILIE